MRSECRRTRWTRRRHSSGGCGGACSGYGPRGCGMLRTRLPAALNVRPRRNPLGNRDAGIDRLVGSRRFASPRRPGVLCRGSRSRLGRSSGRPRFRRSAGPGLRSFACLGSNTGRRRPASRGRRGRAGRRHRPHSERRCRPCRGGCRRLFRRACGSMSQDRRGRPRGRRRSHCLAGVGLDLGQGPRHGTRFGAGFAGLPHWSWRRRSSHSGAVPGRLDQSWSGPVRRRRGLHRRRRSRLRNCRGFLCDVRLCDVRLCDVHLCDLRL